MREEVLRCIVRRLANRGLRCTDTFVLEDYLCEMMLMDCVQVQLRECVVGGSNGCLCKRLEVARSVRSYWADWFSWFSEDAQFWLVGLFDAFDTYVASSLEGLRCAVAAEVRRYTDSDLVSVVAQGIVVSMLVQEARDRHTFMFGRRDIGIMRVLDKADKLMVYLGGLLAGTDDVNIVLTEVAGIVDAYKKLKDDITNFKYIEDGKI